MTVTVTIMPGECPTITGIVATPYSVKLGGSTSVMATVSDSEAGAAEIRWSAPSGGFAQADAGETTFLCAVAGTILLSATATLGDCMNSSSVLVDCQATP